MNSMRSVARNAVVLAASVALSCLTFLGADAKAAMAPQAPGLQSSQPKTVVMDPANGAVLSVSAGIVRPAISVHNICNSGDGCYYSGRIPYANQGFYGSAGTASGSWPYRSAWDTGGYTASACWVGACSQNRFGPNTYITFNGSLVTGTSFTIY
ncbi:hypothetical protein [Streptomyces sp. NPDC046197]|uniref:hypothetical protein n=1 Tax=Streptomyces sp. NPDC046197 TaxID=3154337 RepID=UPI0033E6C9CA